jgi:hypothetical protein
MSHLFEGRPQIKIFSTDHTKVLCGDPPGKQGCVLRYCGVVAERAAPGGKAIELLRSTCDRQLLQQSIKCIHVAVQGSNCVASKGPPVAV